MLSDDKKQLGTIVPPIVPDWYNEGITGDWYSEGAVPPTVTHPEKAIIGGTAPSPYHSNKKCTNLFKY